MGFASIAIVGLGLIGGSLAAAFKRNRVPAQIVGIDRTEVLRKASDLGLIDRAVENNQLRRGIAQPDLIFLATPIRTILDLLPDVLATAKRGALVTDVGSTKQAILKAASQYLPEHVHFLGGHPMTGSEKRGVEHADPLLFENAVYVLVEDPSVPATLLTDFTELLQTIGATVMLLSAEVHDRIAATVSHLPQILAVTLMRYASHMNRENEAYLKLAAGGFRDMTRIASSPYAIWSDIIDTNKQHVSAAIEAFGQELDRIRDRLRKGELKTDFEEASHSRLAIPKDSRGFLRRHYDLSVIIEDKPGVIAAIATTLSEQGINIKDIEILKVREGDSGTMRLAFETDKDRKLAHTLLNRSGFDASQRE